MSDQINPDNGGWQPALTPPAMTPPPPPMPQVGPPAFGPPGIQGNPFDPGATPASYGSPIPVVPSPPKRSKGKVIGAGVAVVALVGGGAFAFTRIRSNETSGGAASPSAVGTALTTALSAEDALGVVDLLLPGERATFRQPLVDMIDNLKRLEILDDTANLGKVGGLDIEFADVAVTATETNVDDISNIVVTGDSTITVDGATVPIGDLLIDKAFDGDRPEMDAEPQNESVEWKMTTVERDGRWYLSLFYTLAEQARGDQQIPDAPVALNGASSPEGALDKYLQTISDQDLEGLLGTLNPNEAEALQRYAPLFIDDAQQELDNLGIEWKITKTEFATEGSGDRRSVELTSLRFEAAFEGSEFSLDYDGKCAVTTVDGEETSSCDADSSIDQLIESLEDDDGGLGKLLTTLRDAFADFNTTAINVQQVDGEWFVSPLGSTFGLLNDALAALDKDELVAIIDSFQEVSSSFGIEDLLSGSDDFAVDPFPTDPFPTDSVPTSASDEAISACYVLTDVAEAVQCFQDGIAAGVIDETIVSVELRFPECNAADVYWNGDIYTLSDEDFTAFVTEVAPCFQQKVADGLVDYYWLAPELWAPECLEGKNWYTASDSDYTTRVFECSAAKVP